MFGSGRRRWFAAAAVPALLGAAVLSLAPPAAATPTTAACPKYELVGLRGQTEPAGFGWVLGPIVSNVVANVPFPIKATPLDYNASADTATGVNDGIVKLAAYLEKRTKACSTTRFLLLGFSMGAFVIPELLDPADRVMIGEVTTTLSTNASKRIAAIVVYGDGGFSSGSAVAAGTFAPGVDGRWARPATGLSAWGPRMRDVCNLDDVICQVTGTSANAHQDYVKYADQTSGFVTGVLTVLK